MSRVVFVTCEPRKESWEDDVPAADLVAVAGNDVEFIPWDDPDCDWSSWDLIINRSTWDYTDRLEEYLAWVDSVDPAKLRNAPAVIRWNVDKRYLADLDADYVASLDRQLKLKGQIAKDDWVGQAKKLSEVAS